MTDETRYETRVLPLSGGAVGFGGVLSLEPVAGGGLRPWRLPYPDLDLFEPGAVQKAANPAGVRLQLLSDTQYLGVRIRPLVASGPERKPDWNYDLFVDGKLYERQSVPCDTAKLVLEGLPAGMKRLEFFPDHRGVVAFESVEVDAEAVAEPFVDDRPRWLTYGSSITQSGASAGPGEVWPLLVARRFGLNVTSLGFGGNCHLEPVVARTIANQAADYISCCVGINCYGASSYSPRTFRAAVLGLILSIRDKHPQTPLVMISPIYSPQRETRPNGAGHTLMHMREQIAEAVAVMQARGDTQLWYVDGLRIIGPGHLDLLPDWLHPNDAGYRVLAENFGDLVMPRFGLLPVTG